MRERELRKASLVCAYVQRALPLLTQLLQPTPHLTSLQVVGAFLTRVVVASEATKGELGRKFQKIKIEKNKKN